MQCLTVCKLKDATHFWEHMNKALAHLPNGCSVIFSSQDHSGKKIYMVWECTTPADLKHHLNHFVKPFASIDYTELDEQYTEYNRHHHRKSA